MTDGGEYGRTAYKMVKTASLLILFVSIIASIIFSIFAYHQDWISEGLATLIIGGSGALATFTLALATFRSIRQNNESLRQLQIDRERPVVIDELSTIIQPSIDQLQNDLMHLRSDSIGYDDGEINIRNPISPHQIDEATLERFKTRHSDLYGKYKDFHELRKDVIDQADEVAESISPEVESVVEGTDQGAEYVIRYLLDETFHIGGTSADFWNEHGEELEDILIESGGEEWEKLKGLKTELREEAESLVDELVSLKLELQDKYGISNQYL